MSKVVESLMSLITQFHMHGLIDLNDDLYKEVLEMLRGRIS